MSDTRTAPLVSVCIANYNGEALLVDCIESILQQESDGPVEIIVHDDASTDSSVALLKQRYPEILLWESEKNVGFCVANNRMLERASGRYVLLLNNDAALMPGALRALVDGARANGDSVILTLPQYDWESGELVDRGCLIDPFFNPVPNLDAVRSHVAYVIGACMFLQRSLWDRLGGFPEWFESIAEDLYLCGLARLRGIPVIALAESGYRHRQGASFGGNRAGNAGLRTSLRRRRLSERNKTRSLIILTPGIVMWPLLFAHLCTLTAEGAVLSLVRCDATLWREIYSPALATPFREASMLLSRRQGAQAGRVLSVWQWCSGIAWQLRKVAMLARYGLPEVRR